MWAEAKKRAARHGAPFTLTPSDIQAVWPEDNRCPVLGVVLRRGEGKHTDASPSLDRLNNAWGYEPGNIAVVSRRANRLKNDATAAELERLAAWMRDNGLS